MAMNSSPFLNWNRPLSSHHPYLPISSCVVVIDFSYRARIFPAAAVKLPPAGCGQFRGNWVRRNAKSWADPDADSKEISGSGGTNSSSSSTSFLSVLCPLLKLFSSGDPSKERNFTLEISTSFLSTLARLPWEIDHPLKPFATL